MIHKITIDVEVPDGYEPTGEYRWPNPNEPFLAYTGNVVTMPIGDTVGRRGNRIILRKKWAFPAWFPNGRWLVYRYGSWYVGDRELNSGLMAERVWEFHGEIFVPPTCPNQIQCVR